MKMMKLSTLRRAQHGLAALAGVVRAETGKPRACAKSDERALSSRIAKLPTFCEPLRYGESHFQSWEHVRHVVWLHEAHVLRLGDVEIDHVASRTFGHRSPSWPEKRAIASLDPYARVAPSGPIAHEDRLFYRVTPWLLQVLEGLFVDRDVMVDRSQLPRQLVHILRDETIRPLFETVVRLVGPEGVTRVDEGAASYYLEGVDFG